MKGAKAVLRLLSNLTPRRIAFGWERLYLDVVHYARLALVSDGKRPRGLANVVTFGMRLAITNNYSKTTRYCAELILLPCDLQSVASAH